MVDLILKMLQHVSYLNYLVSDNEHTEKDLNDKLNQYNRHIVCRRILMARKRREQLKLNTVKTR